MADSSDKSSSSENIPKELNEIIETVSVSLKEIVEESLKDKVPSEILNIKVPETISEIPDILKEKATKTLPNCINCFSWMFANKKKILTSS